MKRECKTVVEVADALADAFQDAFWLTNQERVGLWSLLRGYFKGPNSATFFSSLSAAMRQAIERKPCNDEIVLNGVTYVRKDAHDTN